MCSLNSRTPATTAETNVAESIVGSIAKLTPFGLSGNTQNLTNPNLLELRENVDKFLYIFRRPAPTTDCPILKDPEYIAITDETTGVGKQFADAASDLAGPAPKPKDKYKKEWADQLTAPDAYQPANQAELACQIDQATRELAKWAGKDFRGTAYQDFKLDSAEMQVVRHWYWMPPPSIEAAGKLQAMVDEMTAWTVDLHKKYDYPPPTDSGPGASASGFPPVVGTPVLLASPQALSFSYMKATPMSPDPQTVQVWSGGSPVDFQVRTSGANWLAVTHQCLTAPPCRTPASGTSDFKVMVDPNGLGSQAKDTAFITFTGTGPAAGRSAVVSVTLKPSSLPDQCTLDALRKVDEILDRAKAVMSVLGDYNKALETAQGGLKTNYLAVAKVWDDYQRRREQKIIVESPEPLVSQTVLVQEFNLGTDRKATVTGVLSCVNNLDGKTPTTNNINFSILYQDVPRWSASTGLLTTFQQKRTYGSVSQNTGPNAGTNVAGVTDEARAQVFPMAFVNWRFTRHHFRYGENAPHYGKNGEDTLVWSGHLSSGFGINPNNGANQPEFFVGLAGALNRFMLHAGAHWGRRQSLGGGFNIGDKISQGQSVPIEWSYYPAFSIGFSVRVAPY